MKEVKTKNGKIKIGCNFDELVSPEALVDHPRNSNRHPIEQINNFAKILEKWGHWRYSIVVSKRSGFIVSGHGRRDVALKLGMEKVPVEYQDFKNESEEFQQLTLDNEIARWAKLDRQEVHLALEELDIELEDLGIEDFEIVEEIVATDEDEIPEPEEIPVTKRGDIWRLGDHRLMCGDSTLIDDVDKLMGGGQG